MSIPSPLLLLPPEILPLIVFQIPRQCFSSTLLALLLTTRQLYEHIRGLLYGEIIVKTEDSALLVLGRLLKDIHLGALVRELHIMTDFSPTLCDARGGTTVITELHSVIKGGYVPHLQALSIVFLPGWYTDEDWIEDVESYDHLTSRFWTDLNLKCPGLHRLHLEGIGDTDNDPWLTTSGLYEMKSFQHLSVLCLKFRYNCPRNQSDAITLFNCILNFNSSLQSLTLHVDVAQALDAYPLLSVTFPHLTSLELHCVDLDYTLRATNSAMDFWARHPRLQRLVLDCRSGKWFYDTVEPSLLPNLIHLKADYSHVRAMKSHLPQLKSLAISESKNAQVPYLLRVLLPGGLPNLKSLEIHQTPYAERDVCDIEGAMWYETESGEFMREARSHKAWRTMEDNYMYSIVRGTPNIEELCLQRFPLLTAAIRQLAPVFGQLPRLERLYFPAFGQGNLSKTEQSNIDTLLSDCHILAESCSSLKLVTDVSSIRLPHLVGKITRDGHHSASKVIIGRGFGRQLSGDDYNAFPTQI